jgi:DNA-binding transcriptional LysR family regulator
MRGRFIAALPVSILRSNPDLYSLKELPLEVPMPRWPALMVTLKHRTVSPAVEQFMACARDVAKFLLARSQNSGAMRRRAKVTGKTNGGSPSDRIGSS